MGDRWENVLTEDGEYEVVLRETIQNGTEDFSTLISESKSAGVEVFLTNPPPPDAITMVNQMKGNDWAPDVMNIIRGADPEAFWSALGEDGAYSLMMPCWLPGLPTTGSQEVVEPYRAQDDVADDAVPKAMVGASYGLTQTLHTALSAADSTESTAIRDALLSETFDTTMGEFEFEENGMPVRGQIISPVGQWWEEDQRLVWPDSDSEFAMDLEYPVPSWSER